MPTYDAIIVGAGPNGLAAAIELARAGKSVVVYEAKEAIGGGLRTAELTLPGYRHDVCSAIHPMAIGSPFFRSLPLEKYGLEWIQPPIALAHPMDDGSAALLVQSLAETATRLGSDGPAYARLMQPFVDHWEDLLQDILGPFPIPPRHPLLLARFGLDALQPARWLAEHHFKSARVRGMFAAIAAHAFIPLEQLATASFALVLALLGHALNWPMPRGGSGEIARAMSEYLRSLGGEIVTEHPVTSMNELPPARVVLFDVTPRQLLKIAGSRFPTGYRRALARYRYGPGIFKIDWALAGPVPWKNPECQKAGTLHLGGTLDEIAYGERQAWQGKIPEKPLVLFAQQSLFDATRAPAGSHTGWGYCHVPSGSTVDMTETIEKQVERFAPGFRDLILARHTRNAVQVEAHNPNMIGGDINGGVQDLRQLFTRPTLRLDPYSTPDKQIYLCSSSTPPGGGVHGMCGYYAARSALKALR